MVFEVVTGAKSNVWKYFHYDKNIEKAKCTICDAICSAKGRSTGGLGKHLTTHKIDIKHENIDDSCKKRKIESMDNYVTGASAKKSLSEIIARLCAEDLLSFSVIANSQTIRKAFKADGYKLPENHAGVKRHLLCFYEEIKKKIMHEIAFKIQNGQRLTMSLDEYTSTNNRRYLNINLHYEGGFYSLGLVRAHGSMPANVMANSVKKRLNDFGVDYSLVLAAITDGAPVMGSFAGKIGLEQVICLAHTIQKAIDDVLYPKKKKSTQETEPEDLQEDSDNEDDDENDNEMIHVVQIDETTDEDLQPNYLSLIEKIRKICRLFRKSPVKNDDFLQPEVIKELDKEVKLILDCKTRWYSMMDMVKRFLQIQKPIRQAM